VGFEIVVIGTAAGGLKALQTVLWGVQGDFPLPIVIAQHRRRDSELGLCEFLRQHSRLPLSEPEDKEEILPHHVYLAPRDYHLLIEGRSFALSIDEPSAVRPSIDALFESAADAYGRTVIGVLLTRGNRDGVRGLQTIKQRGGVTLLEARETPQRVTHFAEADHLLPLSRMSQVLENLTRPAPVHYVI